MYTMNHIITVKRHSCTINLIICRYPKLYVYINNNLELPKIFAPMINHHKAYSYNPLTLAARVHNFIGGGEYPTLYTPVKHTVLSYNAIRYRHLR